MSIVTRSRSVVTHQIRTYTHQGIKEPPADSVTTISWDDTVSRGGPIANWRRVIAAGGNATTGLTGVKSDFITTPGNLRMVQQSLFDASVNGRYVYEVRGDLVTGFGLPAFQPNPDLLSEADNQALTRYYNHVADTSTKFKGLVFSGELRESLRMIRSPAKALRRGIGSYLTQLKRVGGRLPKRRRPSFVRDTWLEYSFGWKPLISDLDSAIHAFYLSKAAKPIFEMVKGTGRALDIISSGRSTQSFSQLLWYWDQRADEEAYVKYFGIQFSEGKGVNDVHTYGFRPAEFVPTLWELIPYSFLVDYFSNVGNIIESWSYRFLRNGWTARTQRQVLTNKASNVKVRQLPSDGIYQYTITGDPGNRTAQTVYVTRVPDPALSLPSLQLKVPGMGLKWVNILALSKQLDSTSRALRS